MTFETLVTILTIENLNSWQSLWSDNKEWHWTEFAILAMFRISNWFQSEIFFKLLRFSVLWVRCASGNVFSGDVTYAALKESMENLVVFSTFSLKGTYWVKVIGRPIKLINIQSPSSFKYNFFSMSWPLVIW